jgi:hypothetical protein
VGDCFGLSFDFALWGSAQDERPRNDIDGDLMIDFLVAVTFGWPAIILTIILAIIGLVRRDYRFLVAAAILAVPFSWFLSGFPIIRSPVFVLPVLLFGSAYFMNRGNEMLAWIVAVPFFLSIWLLINAVAS